MSQIPDIRALVVIGSLLSIIPLIVTFLALQRFWQSGWRTAASVRRRQTLDCGAVERSTTTSSTTNRKGHSMAITRFARAGAVAAVSTLALTACATGGTDAPGASGDFAPSDGTSHPDLHELAARRRRGRGDLERREPRYSGRGGTGPNGNGGTYQNFFNQLAAGNAPDLGQIEFDAMPNFRVQDGLENIAACEGILEAEDQFVGWTWSQVTFGEENAVYAIPQDTGPMAMFYRADLFEAAGIAIPTTWEEYEENCADPRAGRLHQQLLAERHQRLRGPGVAGRRPVVLQTMPMAGRST